MHPSKLAGKLPWAIACAEGFSTLAVEVIAIRLAIPVVGSSITLTGVMLGVVLLALSAGYWRGGALSARWDTAKTRAVLARNLFLAAVLYGAVGFPFEALLLEKSLDLGLSLPLAIGFTATLLFLPPIYLASQTVPMLAELTDTEGHAGKASGKVLFFSTVGSVAGGIATPVWLFPSIGVARSAYVVCGLLLVAAAVMAAGQLRAAKGTALAAGAIALIATSAAVTAHPNDLYAFDSAYQSIRVVEDPLDNGRVERLQMMGGGRASGIYTDNGETSFATVKAASAALTESKASSVLVIGAAGFTFPRDAAALPGVREVDAVDVDPAVRTIAEKHFLRKPLPANVRFFPLSARYAVRKFRAEGRRYGFSFVDAFFGKGIPEELVTVEFLNDVHLIADHVAMNVIMDRACESNFARSLLASFREAFGTTWIRAVKDNDDEITNILVTNWPAAGQRAWTGTGTVYHDDRNTADLDHVRLVWN